MASKKKKRQQHYSHFETIVISVMLRMYQLSAANATLFRLFTAQAEYRLKELENDLCTNKGCQSVFSHHKLIDKERLEILEAAYSRNVVITTISMFDSFLSDLTRFLLIIHPDAISKERQVKVGEILACSNFSGVLDTIIGKYVHELAYKSIRDRIQYLNQVFGIDISAFSDQLEKLQKYADLRNLLIHDTSNFRYHSNRGRGRLRVVQRNDIPDVAWETAEDVVHICIQVIDAMFNATSIQVFDREPNIRLLEDLEINTRGEKEANTPNGT